MKTKSYSKNRWLLLTIALLLPLGAAQADILSTILNIVVDGGNKYNWQKIEIPGTMCGNGSQFKFFVNRTNSSNVLFFFEGGGACWDYDTCSGRAGVLGAANPNGIPNDYMTQFKAKYVSPIVNGADPGLPFRSRKDLVTKGWNVVFIPYCTGDVHVGNNVVVYNDTTGGQPPLQFHHNGFANTTAAANWVKQNIPGVQKLLVTGFSAGGTATSAAYYTVRRTINPAKGYYLNDSGPIFPAPDGTFKSRRLHDKIRQSWQLDTVFNQLPVTFSKADFGSINGMVSREFPGDNLAYTGYTRDYNYSRFSYERFYPGFTNNKDAILSYWKEDQDKYVAELGRYNNFGWFIPHERQLNESHCSTIITFIGSHACQKMEKKRKWYEYLEWPWGQTYKCYSEFIPMETYLDRFINGNQRLRVYEPANGYNTEDPGMKILAPIVNAALK